MTVVTVVTVVTLVTVVTVKLNLQQNSKTQIVTTTKKCDKQHFITIFFVTTIFIFFLSQKLKLLQN